MGIETWVLVLWFMKNEPIMTNIPGFATEDQCKEAGDMVKERLKELDIKYVCVKGPEK